jgi:acetylornithine/succinyldiaminopimelate/putrescine aminotransferase
MRDLQGTDQIANFKRLLAQTSETPYLIEVARAEGIHIWDKSGKQFIDMIAGVAVNNIGHRHPSVLKAIQSQIDKYLHVMVYGEYIQEAQINLAEKLQKILPESLNSSYFVNSGTEANEAALKLAKRHTGRQELIAFQGSYHGNTHGSMSVSSNETKKAPFLPLLPEVTFIDFNDLDQLNQITKTTAGVILETIQGDAGVRAPSGEFMKALRDRCTQMGAILIFDEVQVGIGRTGKMFAFEHYDVIPDILTLGKALGGGMPIGAFISSKEMMDCLSHNPMLGHITTFGGHPVVCAAAGACLEVLDNEDWISEAEAKGQLLEDILQANSEIIEIRRAGLLFAIDMVTPERVQKVVDRCLELGLISFWFLSHPNSFRLSPPLSITTEEIKEAGNIILQAIEETA